MANVASGVQEVGGMEGFNKRMTWFHQETFVLGGKKTYEFMRSNTYRMNFYYECQFKLESKRRNYRENHVRYGNRPDSQARLALHRLLPV